MSATAPAGLRRRATVAAVLAAAVAVLLGATAAWAYAGDVPRGTVVLGVDLGGKSRAAAADALRAAMAGRFDGPVAVKVGPRTVEVSPADVGLAIDVEATVRAAADRPAGPVGRLFGTRTVAPVVTVDAARLAAALRPAAAAVERPPRMPAVLFAGTTPKPVYPRPGTGLDPERSAQALREGWLAGAPVTVPVVERQPVTTAPEVDRLVADLARPAVAAPVTVTTSRGAFTVPARAIARSLVLTADGDGRITPRVDGRKLRAALADRFARVEVEPAEARVPGADGKPKVVASTGGRRVDLAALGRDLLAVLPRRDSRQVTGQLRTVEPTAATAEMSRLGIRERVSTFTTTFSGGRAASRSRNIYRIADEVDGAVVKPGKVFSLNGHTGKRDVAQGYREAPVIVGGRLVPGVGGGASQFTTTLFNAAYYAGLEDVEHKPHSFWFSRYPAVIESTIFYPTLDLKFRNNTPHALLIDTSYTADSVTVSIWSTRVYDRVSTTYGPRRNVTQPRTVRLPAGRSCIPTDGIPGFSQSAWRVIRKGGKVVKREKFSWRYAPEPRYICGR